MKYFLICAWICTVLPAPAGAEVSRVRLLSEVTVPAATLRLSDLLPAGAGAQLKAAAEKVSLGSAPQVGSVRVLAGNRLRDAVAGIAPYASEVDVPEQVVVRRLGWPLQTEAVRQALVRSDWAPQLDFSRANLALPAGLATAARHPQFEVAALTPSADHVHLRAQMRCVERTACGSFLVEIELRAPAGGLRPNEFKPASARVAQPRIVPSADRVLVHPRRMALLVITGDGYRITQSVMPLRRGRLGELVRVADPLTHRSLVAQVSGEGELRPADATTKKEAK